MVGTRVSLPLMDWTRALNIFLHLGFGCNKGNQKISKDNSGVVGSFLGHYV